MAQHATLTIREQSHGTLYMKKIKQEVTGK